MHDFKQQPISKNRSPQQQETEPELHSLSDSLTGNFAAATLHPEMLTQLQQQFGNSQLKNEHIHLRKRSGYLQVYGKRNKYREVPLNGTARKVLLAQILHLKKWM